jgi:hypothetical protein
MYKTASFVIITFWTAAAIWSFLAYQKRNSEIEKVLLTLKSKTQDADITSIEKAFESLQKTIAQKEMQIKKLSEENEKLNTKLANIMNQLGEMFNPLWGKESYASLLEKSSKQKLAQNNPNEIEQTQNLPENKKDPQTLMEEISNFIKNRDFASAIKLLKQLAQYGKEYYPFIKDYLKQMFSEIRPRGGRGFSFQQATLLNQLQTKELLGFYKWAFENATPEEIPPRMALFGLIRASIDAQEDIRPYLFQQFNNNTDIRTKNAIFEFLSEEPQYKNNFIQLAKDTNQDSELRKRILLNYANDNSQEVQDMLTFLKNNETNEELKNIATLISNAKNSMEEGFLFLKNGNYLQSGDIVVKVGENDVTKTGRLWEGPPGQPQFFDRTPPSNTTNENITVTVKRNGTIQNITIPQDKLFSELRGTEHVFIKSQ